MCHSSDSEAWQHFNATHPEFSTEIRNVRLSLCRRIQPFWKLRKVVFIVARDSDTLQSPSVDVHEDTIHVLYREGREEIRVLHVLNSHCARA